MDEEGDGKVGKDIKAGDKPNLGLITYVLLLAIVILEANLFWAVQTSCARVDYLQLGRIVWDNAEGSEGLHMERTINWYVISLIIVAAIMLWYARRRGLLVATFLCLLQLSSLLALL
jgi:hypothetical protein